MKRAWCLLVLPLASVAATPPEAADPRCGLQAVELLAQGRTAALAALWGPAPNVQARLDRLRQQLGPLTHIEVVAHPRFARHQRISIQAPGLPQSYAYAGQWINADAAALGAVQFHVAASRSRVCQVLALHLDVAR